VQKIDLFEAGEGGYMLYRIPGIVVTSGGNVLAYCEARRSDRGDWGPTDIMLRRSSDRGETWEPVRRLVEPPAVPKNPVALQHGLGKEGEVTVNNPVAIVDRTAGAVQFLYCVEYARCFTMRSEDEGQTWTEPVEITEVFERFRPEYEWKVIATGPGHGIQLRSGRLLLPVWLSTGTAGHGHRPSCISVIYSEDGGKRWERGEIVAAHPQPANPSETAAVELADGRVMLNLRHEGPERRRGVSVSPDGATRWSPVRFDPALPEPVCMGSLIRLSMRPEQDRNRILFSNPHNPDSNERRNLTVKLSYDEGETWPVAKAIEPGTSGYSDLAVGPDERIYCFYERGGAGASHFRTRFPTLARFDLEWLEGRSEGSPL
jgi:sialidase-1